MLAQMEWLFKYFKTDQQNSTGNHACAGKLAPRAKLHLF